MHYQHILGFTDHKMNIKVPHRCDQQKCLEIYREMMSTVNVISNHNHLNQTVLLCLKMLTRYKLTPIRNSKIVFENHFNVIEISAWLIYSKTCF